MEALSERARSTDSPEGFKDLLTTKLQPDFEDLRSCWGVTDAAAWDLLKSIVVEHHPVAPLRRNVVLAFQVLYAGDPDLVISAIRDFCAEHIHEHVTAPEIEPHTFRRWRVGPERRLG